MHDNKPMALWIKKFSVWIVAGVLLLTFLTRPTYAATGNEWVSNSVARFVEIIANPNVELESYTSATTIDAMLAFACSLLGCTTDPTHPFGIPRSAVVGLSGFASTMYANPPADTYAFVRDMSYSLRFGTKP